MDQVPSHWELYFATDDVDASAAQAKQLGGRIYAPPMNLPGVGALLRDRRSSGRSAHFVQARRRPLKPGAFEVGRGPAERASSDDHARSGSAPGQPEVDQSRSGHCSTTFSHAAGSSGPSANSGSSQDARP